MARWLDRARSFGRATLLALLRLLFAPGRPQKIVELARIRSVLVIRTDDRVGNLLLTTPLLAALRAELPGARLGLLCAARRSVAIEGTGLYDDLWRFEKRDFFRRPWRFVAFCVALRRARYDVAIDAGHWHAFSFTSAALALWSGAPARVGHRRGEADRLLTHLVEKDPAAGYDAAAKLELLRPLGMNVERCQPMSTRLGEAARERFVALFSGRRVLLVNPGARKADHRWPGQDFAAASAALTAELALDAWVAWGPGEEPLAREVCEAVPGARLLPPTDLEELAGALRASALALTNDTGPMHLAVAVGTPAIAVFSSEDWRRWAAPVPGFRGVDVRGLEPGAAVAQVLAAGRDLLSPLPKERLTDAAR